MDFSTNYKNFYWDDPLDFPQLLYIFRHLKNFFGSSTDSLKT